MNIKYNLVLGLETIKENNLTLRYPSIFSSKDKLDGLICKPCAKEDSEKEGRWAIRAATATSSSTELSGESEVVENRLPPSYPQHPKKRVTFEDDNLIVPDHESVGLEEPKEASSSGNIRILTERRRGTIERKKLTFPIVSHLKRTIS